jgi:hypothetical protein
MRRPERLRLRIRVQAAEGLVELEVQELLFIL